MSSRDLVVAAAGSAGAAKDDYFKNVSLLLSGDGTNGAQNNTFLDSSTNNFTITRNGNTTQGTFSPYGSLWSNYFDGSGDWLSVSDSSVFGFGTGDFTVELWGFCSFNGAIQTFIDARQSTIAIPWTLSITGTGLARSYDGTVRTGGQLNSNQWNHIAWVRASGVNTVYVNGVSGHSWTNSGDFGSSRPLVIGRTVSPETDYFNGYISNLRIVKGTALYTSNFTPSTTPLTAVSGTSLLTCQSNRFKDNSSNNFTLTVNGNTSVQRFNPFNPTAPYSASTIGGSGYFDGTGDYLINTTTSAGQLGSGDFTFECWYYTTSSAFGTGGISNYAGLFFDSRSSAGDTSGICFFTNTSGYINAYSGGLIFTSSNAIKAFSWNHIAFARSGTTVTCYINGVASGTFSSSANFSSGRLQISGAVDYAVEFLEIVGYLSNLRVVKGTAVYTSNFTPPTAPLTAITNTSLLCNFTNAGIPDAAMMNDLETVGNAQVSTSVKKYGTGSLYFDGSGDYLTMAATPQLINSGSFTVEFWVNFSSNPANYIVLLVGTSANTQLFITTKSNGQGLRFGLTGVAEYAAGTQTWTTGTWYHVALVRNGTDVKFYVNGTNVSDGTYTNSTTYTGALQIGSDAAGALYFNGYIDDLRITKGYARYTSNFTPPAQALPTN